MRIFSCKAQGFSLIEMIIVIAIIGILSVFAFTNAPLTTYGLEGDAQQLASNLRYTQSLSMTKGQRYRWVKLTASTYQIVNRAGTAITLPSGSTTVTLNMATFGTLTNLPNNLIAFDGKGAPYTTSAAPGTALAANATIPLTVGRQTKTLTITPVTGRIIVQ